MLRAVLIASTMLASSHAHGAPPGCKVEDPLAAWSGAWRHQFVDLTVALDTSKRHVDIVKAGEFGSSPYAIERCVANVVIIRLENGGKRFVLHTKPERLGFAPEGETLALDLVRAK